MYMCVYFNSNVTEVCEYLSIDSANGLSPNRRQAITIDSVGNVPWRQRQKATVR